MSKKPYELFFIKHGDMSKRLIYCNNHTGNPETDVEIIKAITSENYIGPLTTDHYEKCTDEIKNISRMFITCDLDGNTNVWQVCEKVEDYEGFIIPHTYKVRKIGNLYTAYDQYPGKDPNEITGIKLGDYLWQECLNHDINANVYQKFMGIIRNTPQCIIGSTGTGHSTRNIYDFEKCKEKIKRLIEAYKYERSN